MTRPWPARSPWAAPSIGDVQDLELRLDDEPGRDPADAVTGGPGPRRRRLLVGVAVAATAVLAGVAVLVVPGLLPAPPAPAVDVDYVAPDDSSDTERVGFAEDADGRPAGPVEVTLRVDVTATDVPPGTRGDLTVLGVTGPGVRPAGGTATLAVRARRGATASGDLAFSVSCEDLPARIDPTRYGVRVRFRRDGAGGTVLAGGTLRERLPLMVGGVCDGWSVRRDTTVVDVGVTPDGAGLRVTVDNRSSRVVWLHRLTERGVVTPDTAPPGTSVHVIPLSQNDCTILEGMSLARPTGATSLVIGLFGSRSPERGGRFGGATSMVLGPQARTGAADATRRLCSA